MEKKFDAQIDALPYPALQVSENGKILYRNRLAKILLPSAARLRGMFSEKMFSEATLLREMRLDDTSYLVASLRENGGDFRLCFFENFLYLQEEISRVLLGKMQDFFWDLLQREHGERKGKSVISAHTAARICALQRVSSDYLRLLDAKDFFAGEEKVCCLHGFFAHLQRALTVRGIDAEFHFPSGVNVVCEASVLSYLVLNLVHFSRLREGEGLVSLSARDEGETVRFFVDLTDGEDLTSAVEELLRGKADERILSTLPMLCILRVCLERGISWTAKEAEGKFHFSFELAKGNSLPVFFLADTAEAEVSDLLQMVKTIFS